MKSKEKPYYLRQPWDVLFKEAKLDKVSPWSINLVVLLTTLFEEMEKAGIDFRLAGTAINSSVLIYMKKADMLLKMEELPGPKEERPDVYLPPALPLPFRFEHTTTTVNDLIEALEKALTERSSSAPPRIPMMPPPIPDFMDVDRYLLEIEDRSEELYQKISVKYRQQGSLRFTELVYGMEWLDVIRVFMMLLFLAQRMKLSLIQPEDEYDIFIEIQEEDE